MTEPFSNNADSNTRRGILAWTALPLALFPLVALLTYDWRSVSALNMPPQPSTNWIGALGDGFAYYGYGTFGLAVWIVPAVCVIASFFLLKGRLLRPRRRSFWIFGFILSTSCLLQVFGNHDSTVADLVSRFNIQNAGGWIGYLLMSRLLSPLLSDFGDRKSVV